MRDTDAIAPLPKHVALRIVREGMEPTELAIREDLRFLLGRHDAADVVFELEAVSRVHGIIRHDGERWVYEDAGSSNGSELLRPDQPPLALAAHQPTPIGLGEEVALGTDAARISIVAAQSAPAIDEDSTTRSEAAQAFLRKVDLAARTKVPVFLLGPSGSGKSHTARRIHELSNADGKFVPINCARLPQDASALHSELLGHVKGAFTGAEAPRAGKLLVADGGTLFLDEVESLSALAQGFLLDVLEGSGDIAPLGGRHVELRAPIFRLISASKAPLGQSGLRHDLCERLAEGHMWQVPRLEDRRADIPGLLRTFAAEQGRMLGVGITLTDEAIEAAVSAPWPGQIRQLRATVLALAQLAWAQAADGENPRSIVIRKTALTTHLQERAIAFGAQNGSTPSREPSPATGVQQKADPRQLTRDALRDVLQRTKGNRSAAARELGIARNTLAKKMRAFGLEDDPLR